ncbi:MAG: restriction endonuclease subunit S [Gemmatimonadetes bacterium]|nr:restriction endonuclease subunit S [Gemmatimonadota bacterium]MYC91218.1 restriction endonuclease subunit S [Gemmatimonadota bacterium]
MRTVSLQQICDIQIGRTPSRSVPEYWGGELPWVTISDLAKDRIVKTTKERITRIGAAKSRSKWIPRGTLLLSFKLSLGKRAIAGCDLFTNEAIAALRVLDHDIADRDYLYWALGSIDYDRLVDRAAKGRTLNKAKLKLLQIPLPPLTEQKRIAGILDAADALRAKRREALDQLDTLLQSTFLDMFGDPVTNPMGWEVRALKETKSTVQIGPFGSLLHKEDYIVGGVPLVNPMHIVSGQIRVSVEQTVSPQKAEALGNYRLQAGDVVMGRRGEMGRCAIVSDTEAGMLCGTGSLFVRTHPERLSSLFLATTFSSESMKCLLEGLSRGVTMSNLNRTMIEGLKVGLPPLDLQHRYAVIAKSAEQQKACQRAHLAELDTLFASLQSRAFRGDL